MQCLPPTKTSTKITHVTIPGRYNHHVAGGWFDKEESTVVLLYLLSNNEINKFDQVSNPQSNFLHNLEINLWISGNLPIELRFFNNLFIFDFYSPVSPPVQIERYEALQNHRTNVMLPLTRSRRTTDGELVLGSGYPDRTKPNLELIHVGQTPSDIRRELAHVVYCSGAGVWVNRYPFVKLHEIGLFANIYRHGWGIAWVVG